jgi:tRNA/tmRNA/rRNA uracil-C5-methylase (TrmA/RlmC/RlmD family)
VRPPKKFRPDPFPYHHELTLRIDSLTNLGMGVARVDGWVVFVPHCLPGETVRARIYRNDKNFSQADLVEVIEPSPDRVQPTCPLSARADEAHGCHGISGQSLPSLAATMGLSIENHAALPKGPRK